MFGNINALNYLIIWAGPQQNFTITVMKNEINQEFS